MKPKLTFTMSPSFIEEHYNAAILWDEKKQQYQLHYEISEGFDISIQGTIENNKLEHIMALALELDLPEDVEKAMGLDGTTYTLEIISDSSSKSYDWWVELPKEWSEILPIIKGIEKLIDYKNKLREYKKKFERN